MRACFVNPLQFMARSLAAGLSLLAGLLLAGTAQAQVLDDVDWRRDGGDAVLQVRFVTGVQYLRSVVTRSNDQTLVFYRVLPTRQTLILSTAERRLDARAGRVGGSGLPGVIVTDEATSGRATDERRVLVRLTTATKHRVRLGRGDRTLELVFEGLGDQLQPAPAAELPASATGRFRITLEGYEEPTTQLSGVIPGSLQHLNVFTTRRVLNGKFFYETHLGPFTRRADAETALTALRGRFPRAAVTQEGEAAPAPAPVLAAAPSPAVAPPPATPLPVAPAASAAAAPKVAVAPASAAAAAAPPAQVTPSTPPVTSVAAAPAPAPTPAPALTPVDAELDQRAAALLATAQQALAGKDAQKAVDTLGQLLELPPNSSSRAAQALIGDARQQAGDTGRARAEYEFFLKQYPTGPDADRIRAALGLTPATTAGAAADKRPAATTTLTGSLSTFYYGGKSKVRTQEFQDSPLSGLPELVSDATLSDTDQSQLVTNADVNWRRRDADSEQRFVFRDAYYKDYKRPEKSRNKLSSLYYDHRSFGLGTSVRLGRQTPLGGGVLGRFDGVQASYTFQPRWKASAVVGKPTDSLLDAKRHFYGASIEAEALTPQLGGSLYFLEQKIDGEVDRRAIGSDLRYFEGGLSATAQLDYDTVLKGLNVASLQATWQRPDNTVVNFLFDRRTTPMMMLGNTLFFGGATIQPPPTRVSDLLVNGTTVDTLRQQVRDTTAKSTQAALGVTTPITPQWQFGADVRYSSTGAIAPVPDLLPQGQPASGDIWSLGLQLIGTNLYSPRDTHVLIASFVNGPGFQGQLLSYNNASLVAQDWQLEPSIKFYRQSSPGGVVSTRWAPGLRVTWRVRQEVALESEINVESSKTTSATRNESASRTFYYLGGRYDF